MTLERASCSWFLCLFPNTGIIWVYVMVSGFGMLFYHGGDIPIRSRLEFSPPRLQTFLISPMHVNEHVLSNLGMKIKFSPLVTRTSAGLQGSKLTLANSTSKLAKCELF